MMIIKYLNVARVQVVQRCNNNVARYRCFNPCNVMYIIIKHIDLHIINTLSNPCNVTRATYHFITLHGMGMRLYI